MTVALRRRVMLSAIGAAVLALHVVLLLVFGPAWFEIDPPAERPSALSVRSVAFAPAPATPPAPDAAPAPTNAKTQAAAARVAPRSRPASAPVPGEAASAALALAPAPSPQAPAQSAEASVAVPVYPTRLPPPGRWRYTMQRGLAVGEAELIWAPQADARYEMRLQARIAGVTMLDWASQGQLDAAGIAPDRFAQRRRGRDRQAANFQREAGKITFSGPTHELPLLPGAQDRLSWMLQLPAIVAAAPERFVAGSSVLLFVAGARGHGDVWTFTVQGSEPLAERPALKLTRDARSLYDTRIEIWLDPAEHYLPLRVLQTPSGGGAALELVREPELR